jgi:hypothetical protein
VCKESGRVLEGGWGYRPSLNCCQQIFPPNHLVGSMSAVTWGLSRATTHVGIVQVCYTCREGTLLLHMWLWYRTTTHVGIVQDCFTCGYGTGLLHMWGWYRTATHVAMVQDYYTCGDDSGLQHMW